MKKGIFLFSFLFVLGLAAANAQSCQGAASTSKSCCASKSAKAATSDASIEKRMAEDGTVSYVRKESDTQGNVKFVSVQFDEATNTFVNVAPKGAVTETQSGMVKKSCSAEEMKACAGGSASAKACAGGKADKACCASKAAKTDAQK
ncbi:MAG: hypothetical protein IPM98_22540 [Lewinellaceae bacterium]|nr:hypothetical protein [Lewinellaceae bacterium]